jgi:transcriptional regulator NrdR family protein
MDRKKNIIQTKAGPVDKSTGEILEKEQLECRGCGCQHLPLVEETKTEKTIRQVRQCRNCGKRLIVRKNINGAVIGIQCPGCGSTETDVNRSMPLPGGRIRRYRHCPQCTYAWTTEEKTV